MAAPCACRASSAWDARWRSSSPGARCRRTRRCASVPASTSCPRASRASSPRPWRTRSRAFRRPACAPTGARPTCSKRCRSGKRCARSGTTAFPLSKSTAPPAPRASPRAKAGMATSATSERPRAWLTENFSDSSVWSLVAANAIALVLALTLHWSLISLLALYWAQSVIIGIANFFRILSLDHFSTANFTINDRPVEPTPQLKRQTARFFALHYGIFHVVYLAFIIGLRRGDALWRLPLALGLAGLAVHHLSSSPRQRGRARPATPHIRMLNVLALRRLLA